MAIRVPVGHEFFDEIIKNGAYYVDKTEQIGDTRLNSSHPTTSRMPSSA